MMVRSKDDGLTWTKPENLTRKLKKEAWWLLAPSPQQGINLADGTLVMPAQGRDEKGEPFATIMISRDHGATWTVGTPAYSGGNECQAVQLGDGSIMLNMRNDHERYRAVYVTKDLGKTWQPHETNRKTLIEPNCNGSLRRSITAGSDQMLSAVRQSALAEGARNHRRSRSASTTAAPGRRRTTCCWTKAAGAAIRASRAWTTSTSALSMRAARPILFSRRSRWRSYW